MLGKRRPARCAQSAGDAPLPAPDAQQPGEEGVLVHVQEALQNLLGQLARAQRLGHVCAEPWGRRQVSGGQTLGGRPAAHSLVRPTARLPAVMISPAGSVSTALPASSTPAGAALPPLPLPPLPPPPLPPPPLPLLPVGGPPASSVFSSGSSWPLLLATRRTASGLGLLARTGRRGPTKPAKCLGPWAPSCMTEG